MGVYWCILLTTPSVSSNKHSVYSFMRHVLLLLLLLLLLLDDIKLSKVNQGMIKESLSSLIILLLEAARTDTDSTGLRY